MLKEDRRDPRSEVSDWEMTSEVVGPPATAKFFATA
jgi:hypothetical protein